MNLSMTKSRRPAEGLASTLLASLLRTACSVGPTYAPPAATTVTAWQAPLPHNGDAASFTARWSSWNDMTLQVFIDAAEASNPTLAQAAARIVQARARQTMAGSGRRPNVTGSSVSNRGNSASGFALPGVTTNLSSTLPAASELDLFAANRRTREAADARFAARNLDWHQARVSLAAEVAGAYVNLRVNEAFATG